MNATSSDHSTSSKTMFVGGIPGNISESEVERLFSKFGQVVKVKIPYKKSRPSVNKGYCFVTFATAKAKAEAVRIGDHFIGGRKTTCKDLLKGNLLCSYNSFTNQHRLLVKSVPSWVTDAEFKNFFSRFGELETCYLVRLQHSKPELGAGGTSVGYLVYKDRTVCEKLLALSEFKIGGESMIVERWKKTPNTPSLTDKDQIEGDLSWQLHFYKPTQKAYRSVKREGRRRSRSAKNISLGLCLYRYNLRKGSGESTYNLDTHHQETPKKSMISLNAANVENRKVSLSISDSAGASYSYRFF